MFTRSSIAGLAGLLGAALLAAGCSEPTGPRPGAASDPARRVPFAPSFDVLPRPGGIVLDQQNSSLSESGTRLIKGFNPTNPHRGDAIVVTFFWVGSTNIVTSVTDVLTDAFFTPVGNSYALVEYVTAGGLSMATYVATNVQGFPDPNPDPTVVLAVQATLSQPVTDGGIAMSAYSGVSSLPAVARGAHSSGSGSDSSITPAPAGPIAMGAGSLVYGATVSGLAGVDPPAGFTNITNISDAAMKADLEYLVPSAAGVINPTWTWFFNAQTSWLSTAVVLNPIQPPHLVFTVQPSTTLPLMAITPAVRVTVTDEQGNPATSYSGQVTVAIGQNGGILLPGTLSGTGTVTVVNGVATFSDLSIDQAGTGYTLVVTAPGATGATSAPFNIGAF